MLQEFYVYSLCVCVCVYVRERERERLTLLNARAGRYDDLNRMDEIKSLSIHIVLYRLFCGAAKYTVYGNTFSLFEWRQSHALHVYADRRVNNSMARSCHVAVRLVMKT